MYDETSRNAILDSHIASADGLLFNFLFYFIFCGTESFAIFSCPRAHIYGCCCFLSTKPFSIQTNRLIICHLYPKVPQQIHKMIHQYQSYNLK